MNNILPEGAIIGSWDSGRIGYFSDFPVVNLDGLANGYDYLAAVRKDGYREVDLEGFGITHFANILSVERKPDNILYEGNAASIRASPYAFKLWAAEPSEAPRDYARLEAAFDHRAGPVGVMVEGRLVQAVVLDCAPGRMEDAVLVFSWGEGERAEYAGYPWRRNAQRNSLGHCVEGFELPRGAAEPLRLELATTREYVDRLTAGRPPILRSQWDVHLGENRSLVYRKESCQDADFADPFFLHLFPERRLAMPPARWPYGYDAKDFRVEDGPLLIDGACHVIRELPRYPITRIRTGQHTPQGRTWEATYNLP